MVKESFGFVECRKCADEDYYQSLVRKSSSFSSCFEPKINKCIREDNKIQCGDIRWEESTTTDGFCRCDSNNNYRPFFPMTVCFYDNWKCFYMPCLPAQDGKPQEMLPGNTSVLNWYEKQL